ncbi:hypothetical protein LRX75_01535 [Rhizobium sp. DKSPLA3]|uniref:Uncharacterized protein n=1 Tax=Rhizobium quercicola TaxID=2901226 RepID=A0A9X1SYX0_9HYPH|nr:hypothetical protein [Rhizobium quercicola]MCD7107711.1 hypothetical protein [Rhizobium quercicola]
MSDTATVPVADRAGTMESMANAMVGMVDMRASAAAGDTACSTMASSDCFSSR